VDITRNQIYFGNYEDAGTDTQYLQQDACTLYLIKVLVVVHLEFGEHAPRFVAEIRP
jgi:hypothetical protein